MINLMTPLYDPAGSLLLSKIETIDIDRAERRITKTKTLDGGVSFVDGGFSDGDRLFNIGVRLNKAEFEQLDYLHRNYPLVRVMATNGHFVAAILSKSESSGVVTINLSIKEKVS